MAVEINGATVGECYREALFKMQQFGKEENSRAGRVLTIHEPVVLTLRNPDSRVLRDPVRDANPFFHVMETVWMIAGGHRVDWLKTYNKRIAEYADEEGYVNGAYGHRWRARGVDQLKQVARKLRDRSTRQAVISMWDPISDNIPGFKDYPCNTHIYFRAINGRLNMTVCNRSNDLIWGMLGANVVHMTFLQELISQMTDIPLGVYQVITNNLHIYERHWPLLDTKASINVADEDYGLGPPLLGDVETYEDLVADCQRFINDEEEGFKTKWIQEVALPMSYAYTLKGIRERYLANIVDPAWRAAATEWCSRRSGSTGSLDKLGATIPNG